MVSTHEVHHRKIPDSVWSRILGGNTKREQVIEKLQELTDSSTTRNEKHAEAHRRYEWWFCELCGYAADLEQFLRRFPT